MTHRAHEGLRVVTEGWGLRARSCVPLGNGLINDTLAIEGEQGERWVLQRVSPVLSPLVHHNIIAVTQHLGRAGVEVPTLIPPRGEDPWWTDAGGRAWRLWPRLEGRVFDRPEAPAHAAQAARTLAIFHRGVADVEHDFVGLRTGVHDTPAHLQRLRDAVAAGAGHRLYDQVAALASTIEARAERLPLVGAVPQRVVHGDPTFYNILFHTDADPATDAPRGRCMLDLDTLAPMAIHLELGDMFRSWCNASGEDATEARFDLDMFAAAWGAYREHGPALETAEVEAAVVGVEWISLELAARFAADAIHESYFGWDATRHASRGDHNLVRARGQVQLHAAALECRSERTRIVEILERERAR